MISPVKAKGLLPMPVIRPVADPEDESIPHELIHKDTTHRTEEVSVYKFMYQLPLLSCQAWGVFKHTKLASLRRQHFSSMLWIRAKLRTVETGP